VEQFFGNFIVILITGVMKRDQDFVLKSPAVAWYEVEASRGCLSTNHFIIRALDNDSW